MFKIKAKLNGREVELSWDNGAFAGDIEAMAWCQMYITNIDDIGPPGGPTWEQKEIMLHATPMFMVMKRVLTDVQLVEGELPPLPEIPEGAIP